MRMRRLAMIAAAACAACGVPALPPALAQAPAAAQPAPDPAFEAARKAFEALPELDRRVMQDALIWTGDYKGAVDGGFGRGTRDAISAYARRGNLPTDGTLDAKARAALAAAGAKLRDAAGFKTVVDAKSSVSIGLPTKFLPKKTESQTGARFASNDASATVDLFQAPDSGTDLTAMFDKLKADALGRKVAYRVSRPDFFVVSGDAGGKTFYTRVARGTAPNGTAMLRGYTLSYPAQAKATFDIYSIAIASSFTPFPTAAAVASGAPAGAGAVSAPPAAPRPALAGSAIAIGPGRAVAVLPGPACNAAQVGGRAAKIVTTQQATGLTLFDVAGLNAPAQAFGTVDKTGPVVILQQSAKAGPAPAAPVAAPATDLVVAPGDWMIGETGAPRLLAPLQPGASGAAIFSRAGTLVGLAAAQKSAPRLVAGIAPQSTSTVLTGEAVNAFLQSANASPRAASPAAGDKSAADIAAAARASVLPVVSAP